MAIFVSPRIEKTFATATTLAYHARHRPAIQVFHNSREDWGFVIPGCLRNDYAVYGRTFCVTLTACKRGSVHCRGKGAFSKSMSLIQQAELVCQPNPLRCLLTL